MKLRVIDEKQGAYNLKYGVSPDFYFDSKLHLCNGTFKQTKIQNLKSLLVLPSTTTNIAKSKTLIYGSEMFWLLIYVLDINQGQIFN